MRLVSEKAGTTVDDDNEKGSNATQRIQRLELMTLLRIFDQDGSTPTLDTMKLDSTAPDLSVAGDSSRGRTSSLSPKKTSFKVLDRDRIFGYTSLSKFYRGPLNVGGCLLRPFANATAITLSRGLCGREQRNGTG